MCIMLQRQMDHYYLMQTFVIFIMNNYRLTQQQRMTRVEWIVKELKHA